MKKNGKAFVSVTGTPSERLRAFLRSKRVRGAGDVVALIAKPIVQTIDHLAKTNLADCNGCAERKERLNNKFPL